jgi:hypothetical protein
MTIRETMKGRWQAMLISVAVMPALTGVWLSSNTPQNHSFRVSLTALAYVAALLVFCRANQVPALPSCFL